MALTELTLEHRDVDKLASSTIASIVEALTPLRLSPATLDSLDDADLIDLADTIDLDSYSCDKADAHHTAQWIESSERKVWDLPCYALRIGSRVLLWSRTDEAGVADVTVEDIDAEGDMQAQVQDFAEELAGDLGELVPEPAE